MPFPSSFRRKPTGQRVAGILWKGQKGSDGQQPGRRAGKPGTGGPWLMVGLIREQIPVATATDRSSFSGDGFLTEVIHRKSGSSPLPSGWHLLGKDLCSVNCSLNCVLVPMWASTTGCSANSYRVRPEGQTNKLGRQKEEGVLGTGPTEENTPELKVGALQLTEGILEYDPVFLDHPTFKEKLNIWIFKGKHPALKCRNTRQGQ